MPSVDILKEDIKTFSDLELQDLFDFIGESYRQWGYYLYR